MNKRIFNIIKHRYSDFALVLVCSLMLLGCGGSSDESVWNNYDYRYAPPASDGNDSYYSAPQGYGQAAGYGSPSGIYQDNDSSYSAPKSCAPNSPDLCN